ncbi:multinuclear nonheme iron-dependent oxidase [Spirosoma endophyticum]|uniref:Xylose isomerase-like TIM barrel n=1 Tax=Spirosoma endophyticum TaxID=662367 RepID=A0A1I2CDM6_9BACT|nr:DUF692 family multinuclear iron-containing protein [Spirosoma endophyticum]SFE65770.1 Protein of unknown function [Spirosoma endophyticum]
MTPIRSTLACNLDTNLLSACLPLFEAGSVQAIEWSFDTLYQHRQSPDWFTELLTTFSDAGCLIGHGVFFSLFRGQWTPDQQAWLDQLKDLASTYQFNHITEHFGFMTGADFHKGAPLSIPLNASTLAIGQDRLRRIQDACGCPVGLENLAFAYSVDEVKRQSDFLNRLLEPINGFLILDLHNLYCQSQNFGMSGADLLDLYPLDRVREIHISGGSWSTSTIEPERIIRRDTHDDSVPAEVFAWLEQAINRCPNLRYVVLEQLGPALATEQERHFFQDDFRRMDQLVQAANQTLSVRETNTFLPANSSANPSVPVEDTFLFAQQRTLATILETAIDTRQAQTLLATSSLANSDWAIEQWEPAMLETALAIAQKWRNGFN